MKHNVDTIIFDLDGTLLDTLDDLTNSVNHAMGRFGFPAHSRDAVRQMVGNGVAALMEKAVPEGRSHPQFDECFADFREYYSLHKADCTKPFPGIPEFLRDASKAGRKLAVVSNKFDLAVKGLCQDFFSPYILAAVGESAGVARKPAPDTVFAAMDALGSSPGQCIYVGDSEVDIATARNAKIPCICVSWGFRSRDFLISQGAEQIVDHTDELRTLLLQGKG